MALTFQHAPESGNWPLVFVHHHRELAVILRELFAQRRSYFNDSVKLGEKEPLHTRTLAQWSQPALFERYMALYGDDLYRQYPDQPREAKPLKSLWAQWYFGLLVPPLMLALLMEKRALDCSPAYCHLQFHETGRPAAFWLEVWENSDIEDYSPRQRMEYLLTEHLMPVTAAIEATGDINSKLIWNNTGYLMNWFLGELKGMLPQAVLDDLQRALFLEKTLSDGRENPLYRTVLPRGGLMMRRSCCQRYRVPGVQRCGDCILS